MPFLPLSNPVEPRAPPNHFIKCNKTQFVPNEKCCLKAGENSVSLPRIFDFPEGIFPFTPRIPPRRANLLKARTAGLPGLQ